MLGHPPDRRFLALDPGRTTGWCLAALQDEQLKMVVGQNVMTGLELWDSINAIVLDYLIYEDFEYRNYSRAGLDLTPVKIIGVIELILEGSMTLIGCKQKAATGKAYYNDDKLKKYGVYARGFQHGRDATRHLMHFLTFGPGSQFGDIDKWTITMSTDCALAEGTLL